MTPRNIVTIKRGVFSGVKYACAKKYRCSKGELILTQKDFVVNCSGTWSKTFRTDEVQFEVLDNNLNVRTIWYNKLVFSLEVEKPEEWKEALDKLHSDSLRSISDFFKREQDEQSEIDSLLQIDPLKMRLLYYKIKKQRQFDVKNIRFIWDIHDLLQKTQSRKLKAFIIAHCYVACYEWTKKLFYEIYKVKFGKGPMNDKELRDFLESYPSWNFLSTESWGMKANDIRNCVAHEKFYYDYKNSDIVFMVKGKEKRLKLIEMRFKLFQLFSFYGRFLKTLRLKMIANGINVTS